MERSSQDGTGARITPLGKVISWERIGLGVLAASIVLIAAVAIRSSQSAGPRAQEIAPPFVMGQNTQSPGTNAGGAAATVQPSGAASEPVLRAYAVVQGDPAVLAAHLQQQLGATPGVRVVCDQRTRRLLVLAPPFVHGQLGALVAPIGQLGPAADAGSQPTTPTAPPGTAQQPFAGQNAAAPMLGSDTAAAQGAVPAGTSNSAMQHPEAGFGRTMPLPSGLAAVAQQNVQLWHSSAAQFETTLVRLLGSRLRIAPPVAGSAPESVGAYQIPLASGQSLSLWVDRQGNQVAVQGPPDACQSAVQLVQMLDNPANSSDRQLGVVFLRTSQLSDIQRTVQAVRATEAPGAAQSAHLASPKLIDNAVVQNAGQSSQAPPGPEAQPVSPQAAAPRGEERQAGTTQAVGIGQQPPGQTVAPGQPGQAGAAISQGMQVPRPASQLAPPGAISPGQPPGAAQPGGEQAPAGEESGSLIGPVQIEIFEDLLLIRGHPRDVQRVVELINQIEQLSVETRPSIELYFLRHVDCEALAELLQQLYQQVFSTRQGSVSITALVKPNALLLIGRGESIQTVVDLIKKLDRPVAPETQFRVFRLRNAAAETARQTIEEFYANRGGLGTQIRVSTDFRSNALLVEASPRDIAEVAELIKRLDDGVTEAVHELRVFKLKNALATDLAPILQDAITGTAYGQRARVGQVGVAAPGLAAGAAEQERKSVMLRFLTVDGEGRQMINSGILTDVQVTADTRSNSLLVSASPESMPLVEALIRELDELPSAEAQIKVFTLVNGDASSMAEMLQTIFGQQAVAAAAAAQVAVRTGAQEGESTLVPLRFAVDVRTNSIIASGSAGDLTIVEAILLRLDTTDVRNRISQVYRLKNAPAADVANALNEFLRSERQLQQIAPGLVSAFEQIEREVVIVPEAVSNSLIVSATPRFYDEIFKLVEQLDERPPMVMIQVLIAEVTLNDTDEFGVEFGLQDSILFDRSVAGTGALAGTSVPGFLFNSTDPLGNSNSANALRNADVVGSQGLTNLSVGRLNNELGFGGLVLSASSESVNILIRALQECRRLEVLSRPQVMTMDNQTAEIVVGQDVPTITGTQFTDLGGQINTIQYREVGLILTVTPRISPDKLVVMEIDATKSEVGPESEGIPVSVSQGQVIRSPRINVTSARTVVSAMDGQTVVLGGLIVKSTNRTQRRVPYLADIPLVGRLFRYDLTAMRKAELLIIMTPHIVESEDDAERIKHIESARMDWCLRDVLELHGGDGLGARGMGGMVSPSSAQFLSEEEPVPTLAPSQQPQGPTGPAGGGSQSLPQPSLPAVPPHSQPSGAPGRP